jgi:type II secretory pathway pseudopilin PulG
MIKSTVNPRGNRGFALIATILLMVLLAMITVGTLSLSVVTLRTGTQDSAQARARANARMALMIAIGELQKQMGPDQRISANSAILEDLTVTNPHWLGVWNSWKAGTGEASQHSTIEGVSDQMAPTYLPNRSDYFRKWLISLNEDEMSNISSPKNLSLRASPMPGPDDDAIFLVAKGSLGEDDDKKTDYVAARILDIKDKDTSEVTGRYGWWIGDESQKARIMDDSYLPPPPPATPPTLTSADKIYRSAAPGSMGTKTIRGLENVTNDSQFAALPSLATLDLVAGAKDRPAQQNFFDATPFSFSVLADVREGGLKRDLSTILEQPILLTNNGPEYMLYEFADARFPDRRNSRVPIQDLAAYYQLYDNEPTFGNQRREGVQYTSAALSGAIQLKAPDYDGGTRNRQRIIREYTTLYKQPVITKVQFLTAITAQLITDAERAQVLYDMANHNSARVRANLKPIRDTDTHKLKLGIMPMITMWNPNNLPLVMDNQQILRFATPPFGMRWRKYRAGGTNYDSYWFNLNYTLANSGGSSGGQGSGFSLLRLYFGGGTTARRITFEPGEVKVFSLSSSAATLNNTGNTLRTVDAGTTFNTTNDWDPFEFFLTNHSSPRGHYSDAAPDAYGFGSQEECMVFGASDSISISIDTDSAAAGLNYLDGRSVSRSNEIKGAGFSLYMVDDGYVNPWQNSLDFLRHYDMLSRHGSGNAIQSALAEFNKELMLPGFPGGKAPLDFDASINSIPGSQIIAAANAKEVISLMEFSLSVGCETGANAAGGFGGGRRIASRPFLHSSSSAPPFIDQADKASLYDYGWDWQLGEVNAVEDSIVTAKPGSGNGYYGGGYTIEDGTTHAIQREIPVLPAISIASLSHAELGGFSLAYAHAIGENPDTDLFWIRDPRLNNPQNLDFQITTATGQAGLTPHIVQAIGNSYAHPNIPADKSFTMKQRIFDVDIGPVQVPYVDHSYLANKALWDEFFFSSMAPQPNKVPLFGTSSRTAKQVADEFFRLSGTSPSTPLPNRRLIPYKTDFDQAKLDALFTKASAYTDGLADKIAAHLMVEGGFNFNSTSIHAWKTFFSSLKGKPVAYLNGGTTPKEATITGTAISPGNFPNATPVKTADILSPNTPENQWKTGRELTDDEIEQLAVAMVKQVKLRGPFLSTSEFINRRLEGDSSSATSERSVKGALQAALDDPSVSINANFRTPTRLLDTETATITNFKYPDAAKGPIAYGSAPYVDQADVLRHFAEQLTPRGDTFVIRTYGDALNSNGKVIARAWCEAVLQRVPEYANSEDSPELKQADPLLSSTSKNFGRKMQLTGFRWLNPDEI